MDLELIKNEIAQKDGFDTWSQMVECFCTTEPGRKVIDKNVTDLVRRAVADSTCKRQSNIPVDSGMLKHRSGVTGMFVKSFYPTGRAETTIIETDKGYYCAPSTEFVDA